MSNQSDDDEIIARRLAQQGYLNNKRSSSGAGSIDGSGWRKFDVWQRGRIEAQWGILKKEYNVCLDTLYEWAYQVQTAVDVAKGITAPPPEKRKRRNPFKRTLAQGHRTRESDDPTPQMKRPDEATSWNEARMKLVGAIDRYSRKRE